MSSASGHPSSSSSSSSAAGGAGGSAALSDAAAAGRKRKGGRSDLDSPIFVVTYDGCVCGDDIPKIIGIFSSVKDAWGTARSVFFENNVALFKDWVFNPVDDTLAVEEKAAVPALAVSGGAGPKTGSKSSSTEQKFRLSELNTNIMREISTEAYFGGEPEAHRLFKGGSFLEEWDEFDGSGDMVADDECDTCGSLSIMTVRVHAIDRSQSEFPATQVLKELGKGAGKK